MCALSQSLHPNPSRIRKFHNSSLYQNGSKKQITLSNLFIFDKFFIKLKDHRNQNKVYISNAKSLNYNMEVIYLKPEISFLKEMNKSKMRKVFKFLPICHKSLLVFTMLTCITVMGVQVGGCFCGVMDSSDSTTIIHNSLLFWTILEEHKITNSYEYTLKP